MERLDGRVAVVTGGASGIGLGLSRRFLREGMKVAVGDVDAGALERAKAELSQLGEVVVLRTDVSRPADLEALRDLAVARFGAVHLLCNNAGVGGFQRFDRTSLETWEWTLGVDLWGPIHGCRIFLPVLEQQDEAHIVNTSSMAGFSYSPSLHPYNVAKAGVVALTEGLHREFRTEKPHVGVSVLCPGPVATSIADDERNAPPAYVGRETADPQLQELRDTVNRKLAEGKTPDEVAEIVVQSVRERRLHIFTHPEWLEAIRQRTREILDGQPVSGAIGG